ncbi:MAG: LysR family transcriptional regulator [Hoeflea sp.]|uniref:LysR family transcriptional regulator n=1 Tax=Hoeflea sp. TaxID=1940281 RepID=UPI003EF6B6B6
MPLDWDKLRIFHAAAEAGSFTHAAEKLHLSQSAISRQVSALEMDIGAKLFHRHARGLILSEQGEILYQTAHEVLMKLESVRNQLTETRERPSGKLRVTTTVGFGQGWLTEKVQEFQSLYPDVQVQLLLDNEELDVNMRQADCAIRLRQPQQPDLIQRRLFTVHMHIYASSAYLARHGEPKTIEDLDNHKIITFGEPAPGYLTNVNWLETAGRAPDNPRTAQLQINNLPAIRRATYHGAGISLLPDYMINRDLALVQLNLAADIPSFDTYFCYPEEMKNAAKLKAFRDFLVGKARTWSF